MTNEKAKSELLDIIEVEADPGKREVLTHCYESLEKREECEWTCIDDDIGIWECNKCEAQWSLNGGTPQESEMRYCPECGRRLKPEEGEE